MNGETVTDNRIADVAQAEYMAYAEQPDRDVAYGLQQKINGLVGTTNPFKRIQKSWLVHQVNVAEERADKQADTAQKHYEYQGHIQEAIVDSETAQIVLRRAITNGITVSAANPRRDTATSAAEELQKYADTPAAERIFLQGKQGVAAEIVKAVLSGMVADRKEKSKYRVQSFGQIMDWNPLRDAMDPAEYRIEKGVVNPTTTFTKGILSLLGIDERLCPEFPVKKSLREYADAWVTYHLPSGETEWSEVNAPRYGGVNLTLKAHPSFVADYADAKFIPAHMDAKIVSYPKT